MGAIILKNISVSGSRKDILIDKGLIKKIEPASSSAGWEIAGDVEIMDCTGKAAVPGFINMHTHASMTLMRGIGEDMLFHDWLDKIWKIESNIDEEFIYWGTKVACLEMIKTGTTTFNDQYWFQNESARAAAEAGIKAGICYIICDRNDPESFSRIKDECEKAYEDSLQWSQSNQFLVCCHAIYSVSDEMLRWGKEFARKHDLKMHIHVSETHKEVQDCMEQHGGLTPVEYLDDMGFLDENTIAAHTLWLSDNDVEILGKRHVTCVHNINSNLKLASGYRFRFKELKNAGANVCLGTDGCASSNNLDMLEAMKTSAIVQKAWREDPSTMQLDELFACATTNGANALGINTGRIGEGYFADISIVDTDNSFFLSPAPFLANFVYSAHSDCIDSVISNGRFVMRHREIKDEKEILEEARKVISQLKY